ncbi:SIMPL domain-containing protein [Variovorax paradoxus]|uniref:SIMPL domain-containing protein n=1 Tax=Variovorax paradoxus TaxID=34073 RepID=UPI003D659F70
MTLKYLFATVVGLSTLFSMQAALSQTSISRPSPLVQVSGSATVRVTPDEIYLTVGIQSRDKNLQVATQENGGRVANAQAILKQHGVPEKSVQVNYLQVQPNYDARYPEHTTTPVSFTARRSIGIKVTNFAGFERLLNDLYAVGINEVENLEYRSSTLRQHRDKARDMAAVAAREKADALTAQLGVKRGQAIRISENQGSILWGGSSQFAGRSMTQNVATSQQGGDSGGDEALSVGQISVTAHVNVDFLIE